MATPETFPFTYYLTPLGWLHLDGVTTLCAQLDRREFLLTVAPLPIVGGTGSPVNPIATF